MKVSIKLFIASIAITSFASCSKDPSYMKDQSEKNSQSQSNESAGSESNPETFIFKASGDSLAISPAISGFRELLGSLNVVPGPAGGFKSGRREINWDGVPAIFTNNSSFPPDFFDLRGLVYSTPGTGFSVSDNDFSFINPKYENRFNAFSPKKTFSAFGSNITDNIFIVPGTNIGASVQGFGVVFSGVNNASSTSLEFYNGDKLLGSFKVPNAGNNNPGDFSFLGVYFPNEKVTRVRIYSGSAALSPTQNDHTDGGGGDDLVVMDDFIFSEPQKLE